MLATFDSRKSYFNDIGTQITGTQKTAEALKISGLDYQVEKKEIYLADGTLVKDKFATVRKDTNDILGVVGRNFNIVQNQQAFSFIDEIIGNGGADFETAGVIDNGRGAFVLAKTDPIQILDDPFDPYILFSNYHDGSGALKVMFTPIRVWCQNCLAVASKQASLKLSIKHSNQVMSKLQTASVVMKNHAVYIEDVKKDAEILAVTPFTREQFEDSLYKLIPTKEDATNTILSRAEDARVELLRAYDQADLQNFNNSAWKALQAVSDYASHYLPKRDTNNPLIYMQRVQNGEIAAMLGLMIAIVAAKNPALKLNLKY